MRPNAASSSEESTDHIGKLLFKSAEELSSLAHLSKEIQWAISSLLERAHHPDMSAELHVLQDIDRLQQTLRDLSRLIDAVSVGDPNMTEETLKKELTLDSLKTRLFSDAPPSNAKIPPNDITWF